MKGQPDASWGDALFIAFLAAVPVGIAAWAAGASPDVRVGILVVASLAFCPIVFWMLRARRRREWAKRWQGPARMYRSVPPAPAQVVEDRLIEDRGYLQSMLPGARYRFEDDPSGFLLGNLVLLGTRAGIMEFLAEHREQRIENLTTLPGAGIYMAVGTYRPGERYKVGTSRRVLALLWLLQGLSLFVPLRHPAAELTGAVGDLEEALEPLRNDEAGGGKQRPPSAPWAVFAVEFSPLEGEGFLFLARDSVDFGSIRETLEGTLSSPA